MFMLQQLKHSTYKSKVCKLSKVHSPTMRYKETNEVQMFFGKVLGHSQHLIQQSNELLPAQPR